MSKIMTGVLIFLLLVANQVTGAKEDSDHLRNISKAVSAQLLRMKQQKKSGQEKSVQQQIAEPSIARDALSQDTKKVSVATISPSLTSEKTTAILSDNKQQPLKKKELEQKKSVKPKKKHLSNQQKNDHLRLRIQDIVNGSPD
jgi:hypothetical protein